MEQSNFNFFQDHSRNYLEMALKTDKQERMHNPDGYGKRIGVCGDTVEFYLRVKNERIESASYNVDGCMNTNACCNVVSHMIEGRSIPSAWEVTPEAVITYLGTLPADHIHCAELAVGALYLALTNCQELARNPWKKKYQMQTRFAKF